MKRNLTIHVSSRWYRAPEIIMVEKNYDQSADLWATGCIMYELLNYYIKIAQEGYTLNQFERERYLFSGSSCFPLSPASENDQKFQNDIKYTVKKDDQMKRIL